LPDFVTLLEVCAGSIETTVLTNGLLLHRRRLASFQTLDRRRVCFQISVDSPDPELHDAHRGRGSWIKAIRGARAAREAGFRVRWAATVETEAQAREFAEFLDREEVVAEDRVIRPLARRGVATAGVVLARADLSPEATITADGVFWHPVGAEDRDLFVTAQILPLASAFEALRRAFESEHALERRLLKVFHCA
jgi:sulfatase maturation enzyme AslB (radical SAM superfamily)